MDPRNQPFIDPYDHPSQISNYPATVGDGKSGIEARDERFKAALKEYLELSKNDMVPLIIPRHNEAIDIAKTLSLPIYDGFPDKAHWLKVAGSV
jgi:hypothetical protein